MPGRHTIAYVLETIECEGFDYAFNGYSDFEEVKDEAFHSLRRDYIEARLALANYLGVDDA